MIRLVVTGSIPKPYDALVMQYQKMLSPYAKLELLQLKEIPLKPDGSNLEEKRTQETKRALEKAKGTIYFLDAGGKSYSSEDFAGLLGEHAKHGEPLSFILGGSHGFDQALLAGHRKLSLSSMTTLHHLALLFLVEQIYRGHTILAGKTYHK